MPWSSAIYFEGSNHSILSFLIGKERFETQYSTSNYGTRS